MKSGTFLLALVWFSGSVYVGFRLTERSFAWIDAPGSDLLVPERTDPPPSAPIDIGTIKDSVPPALLEQAKALKPQQLLCLRTSIASERYAAVLAGNSTPQEAAAVKKCLE